MAREMRDMVSLPPLVAKVVFICAIFDDDLRTGANPETEFVDPRR